MNPKHTKNIVMLSTSLMLMMSTTVYADVVTIEKQNTGFSIDGFNGAQRGKQMILWPTNLNNRNQQWIETNLSQGHVSFRKKNTALCLDGGEGAQNRQAVTLETCDVNNEDQHWAKVSAPNGSFRLEKRDTNFSIDGNRGAQNGQLIYLWSSDSSNVNQQWDFLGEGGSTSITVTPQPEPAVPVTVEPIIDREETDQEDEDTVKADANVFSLAELRQAVTRNNQTIVVQAGNYSITDLPSNDRAFIVSGNNNTIDLTGVHIDFPVDETSEQHFLVSGTGNTITGGTLENTYPNGEEEITDFISYNQDRNELANGNDVHVHLLGDDNTLIDTKIIVRGSYPFGYGSQFGIGRVNSFGLSKRGGIQINGRNTVVDGVELYMYAFGHGIFAQEPADNTTIRNTLVEGLVRETNAMLAERGGSLPLRNNYLDADGDPIPENEIDSLAEDGIRAYSRTGSYTLENNIVRNMRGGIRMYLARSATISNTVSTGNGLSNFNIPNGGTVTNSSGNFNNGPLIDYGLVRSRHNIEVTIIPSPDAIGSHNIADIFGNDHEIVFHRTDGPIDSQEQRVIYVTGDNSTIRNETEYKIILEDGSRGNTVISAGDVTDNGNNDVSSIPLDL